MPRETAAVSVHAVYTIIQPCTMLRHLKESHILRVHICLAVTCTFGRRTRIFYVLLWSAVTLKLVGGGGGGGGGGNRY